MGVEDLVVSVLSVVYLMRRGNSALRYIYTMLIIILLTMNKCLCIDRFNSILLQEEGWGKEEYEQEVHPRKEEEEEVDRG